MRQSFKRALCILTAVICLFGIQTPTFAAVPKYPTSIKIQPSSVLVIRGNTVSLSAVITPKKVQKSTITWSSSDKTVATVTKKGVVKGIKYGKATITAKTANGKTAKCTIYVGAKRITYINLNAESKSIKIGGDFTITAKYGPKYTKLGQTLTYTSSNPDVATVSQDGKVHGIKPGNTVITVAAPGGIKAECKIKVLSPNYTVNNKDRTVTITMGGVKRTYKRYSQHDYTENYYTKCGCVETAVAIAATGFGMNYTTKDIHEAPENAVYGEKYAIKKLGFGDSIATLYDKAAISIKTGAQILRDMGIPAKEVPVFTTKNAIKEITNHVKSGKPVIVKANNNEHNGVKVAVGHHAMVLIGIDRDGNGVFINPSSGKMNTTHATGKEFHMSISDFVTYHMSSSTEKYNQAFVTSRNGAWGYILVG